MTAGHGIFFDGAVSARQEAKIALGDTALHVTNPDGRLLAEWPFGEIEEVAAPDGVLRLARRNSGLLARLEIRDAALATAIDERAEAVDRSGSIHRRQRASVIAWSVAATVSLVLLGYYGVPALAERLAPLVPPEVERRLGAAVDMQVRGMLDKNNLGEGFECGARPGEPPGKAAFEKMFGRLERAAALPVPLRPSVIRREEANAIALPGGRIYVFEGLIAKAENPDEVAGVIAHELGHVANRDNTTTLLQGAGLSLLFGMVLGDFVGGGAVVLAARTLLQLSYSRDVELGADRYAARLMDKAGGEVRALGTMLERIGGATEPGAKILLDHPETKARVAAINAVAPKGTPVPFLDAAEWAAMRRICGGR
ncbi:MAG: M48 family metallopeptidase [Pseudolabrys sp.]|nr:M48 family metallopeptidase [Pseudolabrys sp.]MBV9956527.1 M48 family metallopeptidase [Pseudolabrys sp.]